MIETIASLIASSLILFSSGVLPPEVSASAQLISSPTPAPRIILAQEAMDLSIRNPNENINEGFKQNILVNLGYLKEVNPRGIVLSPGEMFAFHKNILPEFMEEKIITQNSEFRPQDGYLSVAGLYGNGVCHLASLMNWVATEAGLEVTARVNHDYAPVPGIDRQFGTSIKFYPNIGGTSERQNLYIKNTLDYPVRLVLEKKNDWLHFYIEKATSF